MIEEAGARRRRLRAAIGDRGQSLFEFAIIGTLLLGSAGLFLRSWGPEAAPWGFGLPIAFLIGYVMLDARRQAELRAGASDERVRKRNDLAALVWTLVCCAAAGATFVYMLLSKPAPPPPPPEAPAWQPPDDAVIFDFSPR